MTLIESLIALLVLAVGLLGLAGVQARMLVENRTSNQRAVAISLIDDMFNRMRNNRDAATAGGYTSDWSATVAVQNCTSTSCTATQLAQSDLNQWRSNISALLPGGDAKIFTSSTDARQIGIAIAWPANESSAASSSAYTSPFAITTASQGVACPDNLICHLVYVQP
ncbi:type IV pilus modification protein PilV [Curvibacter sp. CHRR-16]|nr:type IV pilus modification protein PilV [Curvibacter sp. CHRR-16]MBT0569285.1 type IV pilus modification protein PilV [Curvibacter sp. CHRR-16]